MKVLPESFGAALGIFRPLVADDGVLAVCLHGCESAWVERVGTPPRGMEPMSADAFAKLLDVLGGVPARPVHLRLAQGGHVRVLPAPVKGGALVVLVPGHLAPLALDALAPADVVDTLLRSLAGGLGVLVTGSTADMRVGLLGALWESMPMDRRRALVEVSPGGVMPLGALHWCTGGDAQALEGLALARVVNACAPELHLGGAEFLRALAGVGSLLASCAGVDAAGARALFLSLGEGVPSQAAGLFHVVVELGPDPQHGGVRVLTLWDGRAVLSGGLPSPWWRASAGGSGGTWTGSPAFAWRIPSRLPLPVVNPASGEVPLHVPREAAAEVSFSVRATQPTGIPASMVTQPSDGGAVAPPDVLAQLRRPPPEPTDPPTADIDESALIMESATSRAPVLHPPPLPEPSGDEWLHLATTTPLVVKGAPGRRPELGSSRKGPALPPPPVGGTNPGSSPGVPPVSHTAPTSVAIRPPPRVVSTPPRVATRTTTVGAPASPEDFEDASGTQLDPRVDVSDVFTTLKK